MKRYEHRLAGQGPRCTRCGLMRSGANPYCPPGFWMTAEEHQEWAAVPREEKGSQYPKYAELEKKFRERHAVVRGTDTKEKTR